MRSCIPLVNLITYLNHLTNSQISPDFTRLLPKEIKLVSVEFLSYTEKVAQKMLVNTQTLLKLSNIELALSSSTTAGGLCRQGSICIPKYSESFLLKKTKRQQKNSNHMQVFQLTAANKASHK